MENNGYHSRVGSHTDPENRVPEKAPSPFIGHLKYLLCLILHGILVACHAILLVVSLNGHPLHLVPNNWATTALFQAVSYGPNALGKGYLVILLYYTQKLALRRNLHQKQTLTAIHDKSTAWLGLGSAIPVLYDQYHTAASTFGVLGITFYLGGLFVLGITTPILFTVGAVYNGETRFMNLTTFLPYVGTSAAAIENAYPIVELVPLMDLATATYGLQDYMIYDTPTFSGSQAVSVDATRVNVICQALPNAAQSGDFDTTNGTFSFSFHPDVEDVVFAPTARSINIAPLTMKNKNTQAPPTFIVASTMQVVDDTHGVTGPTVQLNPAIVPDNCTDTSSDCSQFASLQLLACDVDMWNTSVRVVPWYGLADSGAVEKLNATVWNDWDLPKGTTKPILSLMNWFPWFSSYSGTVQSYHPAVGDFDGHRVLTTLELNVMETLGFFKANVHELSLGELDLTLERAVAAVFWRSALSMAYASQIPLGPAVVNSGSSFKYSVQISRWPLLGGLATSVVLFLLAAILTRHAQPATALHGKLGEPGVLQLTWLLGQWPTPAETLSREAKSAEFRSLRSEGKKIVIEGWTSGYNRSAPAFGGVGSRRSANPSESEVPLMAENNFYSTGSYNSR